MGLASAMSTALTGLTAAETTIDVVGNNLANSNTVGFKASEAAFATQFLQTQSLGSAPTEDTGGTNPRQIGLGTMVAQITPNFNQGTVEISSNPMDLAIQGEGFFIVQDNAGGEVYTRNGIFKMNSQNELVTITGNRLLGYGVDENYQIQTTSKQPISIPIGAAAVAEATRNVFLQGTLLPTGDVADTPEVLQTDVLSDGQYSYPADTMSPARAMPASTAGMGEGSASVGGATMDDGDYYYRVVYADRAFGDTPDTEGVASTEATALQGTVDPGDNALDLTGIADNSDYSFVRVYRALEGQPAAGSTYYYVGEVDISAHAGPVNFTDTAGDAAVLADPASYPPLDQTATISGVYSYYVTFYDTLTGRESRPCARTDSVSTDADGDRIHLTDIPTDAGWTSRRIYRNTGEDRYYLVAQIDDQTTTTYTDYVPDTTVESKPEINLDGPDITNATRLVDLVRRDGTGYFNVFEEGTLSFAGKKGGQTLGAKQLEIDADTTVQQLYTFMGEALGIQDIPGFSGEGGSISSDSRIRLTGNPGVHNAIDVGASAFQLTTASGTSGIDMPFSSVQSAVGESAVANFPVYDSLGIALSVRLTAVMEAQDGNSTTYRWFADCPENDPLSGAQIAVGTGQITFDGEGNFTGATDSTVSIQRRHVPSISPLSFELDFSRISGLASQNEDSTLTLSRQDGSPPGVLTSFIVGEDGRIRGVFSNGVTRDLGQIRLARFGNPAGLEQRGENVYAGGVNSGLPVEADPGEGVGSIIAGAVELSNTDIGGNLIDLILAATMYRGNTRVITTAQQLFDELLSLRR